MGAGPPTLKELGRGKFAHELPVPEAPPPRDIGQETRDTLQAQIDLAPGQFAAESEFAPQYAQLYQDILNQNAPQLQSLQGRLNTQQRTQDINDVMTLGPQAMAAYNAANPQLASLRDAITQRALTAQGPISMLGGPERVNAGANYGTKALLDSTLGELAKGGSLTQQETLANQDATVNRFNQMGRAGDPSSIAGTALGLDAAQQARLTQRQNAAGAAASLYNADLDRDLTAQQYNTNATYQTGLANQGAQLSNANYINSLMLNAGNFAASTQQDPFSLVLGRSTAPQQSAAATNYTGSGEFDPFNSAYASDLYNTNFNAASAQSISQGNNNAAQSAGNMQAIGSVGGAVLLAF